MAICWERVVPLAFHLCCVYFSAVLVVRVPFPFGVWGRVWNSFVLVPDHCLFIYFARNHCSCYTQDKSSKSNCKYANDAIHLLNTE